MRRTVVLVFAVAGVVVCAAVAAAAPSVSWKLFPETTTQGGSQGRAEFQDACAICHGAGPDRPGTSSLQFKYGGRLPALLEQRTDLSPAQVKFYIRHGIAMMPAFRKTELSDEQADAIANYIGHKR
jgi:mono/diheme cytochrome c family protein